MTFKTGDWVSFKSHPDSVYRVVDGTPRGYKDMVAIGVSGSSHLAWTKKLKRATEAQIAAEIAKRFKGPITLWKREG